MPLLPIPERHFRLGNEAWAVDDCSYNNAVNKLLERERDYLSESVSLIKTSLDGTTFAVRFPENNCTP